MFYWLLALLGYTATTSAGKPYKDYGVQFGPNLPPKNTSRKWANEDNYNDFVNAAAFAYNIPVAIIKGIIATESGFNPNAKAKTTSATGLMQMTVAAAKDMGFAHSSMTDPKTAIMAGTKYLAWNKNSFKFTLNEAIQAYYAGAGVILDYKRSKISTPRYEESKTYLNRVLTHAQYFAAKVAIA